MRQPIVFYGGQSPLARTFSDIARVMTTGPTAEQREYTQALADQTQMRNEMLSRTNQAQSTIAETLPKLFGQFNAQGSPVKPWVNPDSGQVIQNTTPAVPLASPEQTQAIRAGGLAQLFSQIGGDASGAVRNALEVSSAYGSPDDMRRAMVLQGRNIDPNFSPTADEGNRIAGRNNALATSRDLSNIRATPLNRSQFEAQMLRDNFDDLDSLTLSQKKALGALPNKGALITTADGTTVSLGGDVGPQAALSQSSVNRNQKDYEDTKKVLSLIEKIRSDVKANPQAIGLTGNVLRGGQKAFDIFNSFSSQFKSPDELNRELARAEAESKKLGLNLNFDPKLHDPIKAHNLLVFMAREALTNLGGDASKEAIRRMEATVGSPDNWVESPQSYISGLDQLYNIVSESQSDTVDRIRTGRVMPGGAQPQQAPAAAAQPEAPSAEDPVISETLRRAQQAIQAGKPRAAVIQRLLENGINVPEGF